MSGPLRRRPCPRVAHPRPAVRSCPVAVRPAQLWNVSAGAYLIIIRCSGLRADTPSRKGSGHAPTVCLRSSLPAAADAAPPLIPPPPRAQVIGPETRNRSLHGNADCVASFSPSTSPKPSTSTKSPGPDTPQQRPLRPSASAPPPPDLASLPALCALYRRCADWTPGCLAVTARCHFRDEP